MPAVEVSEGAKVLNEISGGLDMLSAKIEEMGRAHNAVDTPFSQMWGWNLPTLSYVDMASYVSMPKRYIIKINPDDISLDDLAKLNQIPNRIQYLINQVVPNFNGGNTKNGFVSIQGLVISLDDILSKYVPVGLDFEEVKNKEILPASQIRKLSNIKSAIEKLSLDSSYLEGRIRDINDAHDVAQSLPADMQSLQEARKLFESAKSELDEYAFEAKQAKSNAIEIVSEMEASREEAERIMRNLESAYSAATTVGLGSSFSDRAKELMRSVYALGVALVLTLVVGLWLSSGRIKFSQQLLTTPDVQYGVLLLNLLYVAFSVAAPVWLAWLLTRQIGQRFRLAEDYGYKASIAKAYEGYRREADQIDSVLSRRLFSIALDKLGEAPLRLVEKDSPGSPLHDVRLRLMGRKKQNADISDELIYQTDAPDRDAP